MALVTGRVRQEGSKVLLEINGKSIELPHEVARAIGRGLIVKAQQASEYERANLIIADSAFLLRAGIPIGLTSNPKILAEARKEAQSDRTLRKYLPGGIKSQEQVGAPVITQTPPPCQGVKP